jgi:hypothetical protein
MVEIRQFPVTVEPVTVSVKTFEVVTVGYIVSAAVTVTVCEPTVVAVLVQTDIKPVALMVSSVLVIAVIPAAGAALTK